MKIRYNREIISGAIFVVLSAVLWFLIPVQVQTLEKTPINAQTFPRIAIGGMFLCSVGLLLEVGTCSTAASSSGRSRSCM